MRDKLRLLANCGVIFCPRLNGDMFARMLQHLMFHFHRE